MVRFRIDFLQHEETNVFALYRNAGGGLPHFNCRLVLLFNKITVLFFTRVNVTFEQLLFGWDKSSFWRGLRELTKRVDEMSTA